MVKSERSGPLRKGPQIGYRKLDCRRTLDEWDKLISIKSLMNIDHIPFIHFFDFTIYTQKGGLMWFKGIMETSWRGIYAYRSSFVSTLFYVYPTWVRLQIRYASKCSFQYKWRFTVPYLQANQHTTQISRRWTAQSTHRCSKVIRGDWTSTWRITIVLIALIWKPVHTQLTPSKIAWFDWFFTTSTPKLG